MPDPLLDVQVRVEYRNRGVVLRQVRLEIGPQEIFGLAGQSGSGKSTLALAVLGLLDPRQAMVSGRVTFQGRDLLLNSGAEMRRVRGKQISLVLQSPLASLNPRLRLGAQLKEAWTVHETADDDWETPIRGALAEVSLPANDDFLRRYPRELSVGMAQRLLIAMAVLHRPKLIIADEATSALDVITQSEILDLFRRLNRTYGSSILYITHDLASVAALCHRIGILHQGEIVETGPPCQIFGEPNHVYTRKLLSALPRIEAFDRSDPSAQTLPLPL